jgi:hypothetical protein
LWMSVALLPDELNVSVTRPSLRVDVTAKLRWCFPRDTLLRTTPKRNAAQAESGGGRRSWSNFFGR